MYRTIKIAYWLSCFLFLVVFYRWVMPNLWVNVASSAVNVLFFIIITETFIHRRAIPVYFQSGKYRLFAVSILLCGIFNATLTLFVTWTIIQPFSNSRLTDLFWSWENLIYSNFFVYAAFTAMSIATRLLFDWFTLQKQIEELEKEKIRAELDSLKAQINPHFLFNSLNSIYGRIDRRNVEARDLLIQFSDLLRYQLYECNVDFIDIEKEIEYLQTFVRLHRERKSEKVKIDLKLEGCLSGYKIAPLLLVPFVENAFKFVSSHERKENYLSIELDGREDSIFFKCLNTRDGGRATDFQLKNGFGSGGIGLSNVERRLELIYPGKYKLDRYEDESLFRIELAIETKQL